MKLFPHGRPCASQISDKEKAEQKHVMGDHTAPGGNQAKIQQLGANKRTDDTNAPHTGNVIEEGEAGLSHALHHALNNDGKTVERL